MKRDTVQPVRPLRWEGDAATGSLVLLDQTRLPLEEHHLTCCDLPTVAEAIMSLRVRGAPAIGVAAAYGMVLAAQSLDPAAAPDQWHDGLTDAARRLAATRPTAVNLFWALERMSTIVGECIDAGTDDLGEWQHRMLEEARRIESQDRAMCHAIGYHGADLLEAGAVQSVLTHCNAGSLATAEYGTALGVIYAAVERGRQLTVYVDETRPLLQGARLTAWELMRAGIDVTLICDSAAARVMREGRVQAVITGADRIARNGDTANKIGTYGLALAARQHGIPFYVAAPTSTFDPALGSGDEIPIELRGADEVACGFGRQTAPHGVAVYNPAFDVTPAEWITALITERGVVRPVSEAAIDQIIGRADVDASGRAAS